MQQLIPYHIRSRINSTHNTGKLNSTRVRLVQLVALPLLVTRAINPILHS